MPGCDFHSLEDSVRTARKVAKQVRQEAAPAVPVVLVVEPRGKRKKPVTVRRDLERLTVREDRVAQELGLKKIGTTPVPDVPWVVLRSVFAATPDLRMSRKECRVVTSSKGLVLARRFNGDYFAQEA